MKNKTLIKDILIYIGLILLVSGKIFIREFNSLDEIWVFNTARCFAEGLLPYRDFTIIITPLFSMIAGTVLKIFGTELIVFRFLECLEVATILFAIYKILVKLEINKNISLIAIIGIYVIYSKIFTFDYNWAVLLVTLFTVYMELKFAKKEFSFRRDFILGIFVGFAILFKQTIGGILAVVFIGYKILEINKASEIKQFLRVLLARILGVLVPVLVFIIYLLITNTYTDFIDYAILGIVTFANISSYLSLLQASEISIRILAVAVPITLIIMLIICIIKLVKQDLIKENFIKKIYILLAFGIANITAIFPIADVEHFGIGAICTVIAIIYLVYNLIHILYKYIKFNKLKLAIKIFFKAFSVLLFIIYIIYSMITLKTYIGNLKENQNLKHFQGVLMDNDLANRISIMDEYLLEKEKDGKTVYILDSMSAIFTIPIDKYYKNYDIFDLGNFGGRGEERNHR